MTVQPLPFDYSSETIFTKVGAASTVNYIIEQKDAEYGLFGRVEEMSEPVSVARYIILFVGKGNERRAETYTCQTPRSLGWIVF